MFLTPNGVKSWLRQYCFADPNLHFLHFLHKLYHLAGWWSSDSSPIGGLGRYSSSFGPPQLFSSPISTGTPSKAQPPRTSSGWPSGRTKGTRQTSVTTNHSTIWMGSTHSWKNAQTAQTRLCYFSGLLSYLYASGHAITVFFAICCENWHIRWIIRRPVNLRVGLTCF